jgi:hypothetical protein
MGANDSGAGGFRHFRRNGAGPIQGALGPVPVRPGPDRGMRKKFALSTPNAYLEFKRWFEKGPA